MKTVKRGAGVTPRGFKGANIFNEEEPNP